MTDARDLTYEDSIFVNLPAGAVYDLVSDITRTGEWSPVCTSCWWDDPTEAGRVGAWFTGHNETPQRTWETRSKVVAAERGREFVWIVGGDLVSWGFHLRAEGKGTTLTESWHMLPGGLTMFAEKYGERAQAEVDERTDAAYSGIPVTLAAIKRIAESRRPAS